MPSVQNPTWYMRYGNFFEWGAPTPHYVQPCLDWFSTTRGPNSTPHATWFGFLYPGAPTPDHVQLGLVWFSSPFSPQKATQIVSKCSCWFHYLFPLSSSGSFPTFHYVQVGWFGSLSPSPTASPSWLLTTCSLVWFGSLVLPLFTTCRMVWCGYSLESVSFSHTYATYFFFIIVFFLFLSNWVKARFLFRCAHLCFFALTIPLF